MVVWVTGASSGLGLHTAQAIARAGHTVIAGARSFRAPGERDGMHCLPLDVTDAESVRRFAEAAERIAPGVEAVVHCAGILVLASCEETTEEEYRRVMDTDFFGMVRVNRAALPLMRARGRGKILMFSSINGLLGVPFQSAYTAAKHAVEGYAECLDLEARPHGIQVCLIEPGDHRSGSDAYRAHGSGMGEDSPYWRDYKLATGVIHHDESHGSDPDALGRKVARLLGRKHIPGRKCIASLDQHLAVWLHALLPMRLNGDILRSYYRDEKKAGR